jgi:dipeptidyl aminopeptidase/acylaminoacyl peptidase
MGDCRDVRYSSLYREIEGFYAALHSPGTDSLTDASDLSVTPDGQSVSFTGTVFSTLEQPPVTRIATLRLDRGTLSIRPPVGVSDRLPRWSPDGRTLAFLTDRDGSGSSQVCLAGEDGRVWQAPSVDGVVESLAWSPDGEQLLLGVAGFGADVAGVQGGTKTYRGGKESPSWLPHVDSGDGAHLWRHVYLLHVASQRLRRVGPERLNIWESCWLGNRRIAAIASGSHSEGSWYGSRLVIVDEPTGSVRELYSSKDQIGMPAGSASGEHLVLIEAVSSDRLLVCGKAILIEVQSGSARRLDTGAVDVSHVAWRDETTVVYAGIRGLETVLGELDGRTGIAREWWTSFERTCGGLYPSTTPLPGGGALVVGEAWAVPPQIARVDANGYHCVYSLASEEARDLGFSTATAEALAWTGRDGLEIQGVLIRPEGKGPWPLVMDIHGGPVWACRNRWQGRLRGAKVLADHGIASLYPNPRGSSGRGDSFARLVKGDMGGEDGYDCLRGVDALIERGIADRGKLGVTGISYGGYLTSWLVTRDGRFAAAVPISPITDWYSQHRTSHIPAFDTLFLEDGAAQADGLFFERSPVMFASRVRTPVLQLAGGLDQNTPPSQALEFHRSLLEHGVRSVLVTYPTAGHGARGFPQMIDATARYVGWFLEHLV